MITLQSFLTPDPEICSEQSLYARLSGAAAFCDARNRYVLSWGGRVDFGTYFNLFNLGTWQRTGSLPGLCVEIMGRGKIGVEIFHAQKGRSWTRIYSEVVTLVSGTATQVDLASLLKGQEDGILLVSVIGLAEMAEIVGGRFAISAWPEAQPLPELTISITTFKREAEVRRTVERVEAFLATFTYGAHIRLQVVDNGQSAGIQSRGAVVAFDNTNLGGAGGFARGLLEAEEAGASHCLFMDDDASFHMENIARTYMLLALSTDPKVAIAGAMITNTCKWQMWENGAWFDGSCHPLFNGVDLRDISQVINMVHDGVEMQRPNFYGGWWFFAFPIREVTRHPFPFFVRGDDINFSLSNDFNIYTLNGVVSFQDDFTTKENALTLYLDLRNHLVQHLTVPSLQRSALGTARVAIYFTLRSLLRYHYSTAAVQLMAWEDVMQGPEFFEDNIDMSARREVIQEMSVDELWQPLAKKTLAEKRGGVARWSRRARYRWGLLTLNGHMIPFGGASTLVVDINYRASVFEAFGAAEVTYLNTNRDKSYTVRRSRKRFLALMWLMLKLTLRMRREFGTLQNKYKSGYEARSSKAFWQKILGKV